jgi:hypothetical protein
LEARYEGQKTVRLPIDDKSATERLYFPNVDELLASMSVKTSMLLLKHNRRIVHAPRLRR